MGFLSNLKEVFNAKKEEVKNEQQLHSNANVQNHRVAGTTYYEDNIIRLAVKNSEYDLNKKDIVAKKLYDKDIFQYIFPAHKVELIPDPTNEHDQNAIKVMIGGLQVGYIKAGSCARISKLIESNRIESIECFISGGNYKYYWHDGISLQTKKGKNNYNIQISIAEIAE